MASIEISEFGQTTVTSLGDNGEDASCSGTLAPSYGNHLGVQADAHHARITLPAKENGAPGSRRTKRARKHGPESREESASATTVTCSFCSLKRRFHLFSIFRYIFIGIVFTTWLAVTVSICVMAFSYAFYLGLVAMLIVFLQLLPVIVICIATYGKCCGICDGRQGAGGYRAHVINHRREHDDEQRAAPTANFSVVMPTVVVSQAIDAPSVAAGNATSC